MAAGAEWKGTGGANVGKGELRLHGGTEEPAEAVAKFPVQGGERFSFSFLYDGDGLGQDVPLRLKLKWFDADGHDLDDENLALGFPLDARQWVFTRKGRTAVAEMLTVPTRAVEVEVRFLLPTGKSAKGIPTAAISGFSFAPGEVKRAGIEVPESGPEDAGALSAVPAGGSFGENLVPNAALEEGEELPTGWKVEGDNRGGAAEWADGGAYSGHRAFRIHDRGPYVKSWERKPEDPFFPGGRPGPNWASAREEISARWMSDPVPAEAGQWYQTTAFYWYEGRYQQAPIRVNPVRIQFLDAKGKPLLPKGTVWYDWMPGLEAVMQSGWVFAPGSPVQAPEGTVQVRAVVAMCHAFHQGDLDKHVKKISGQWNSVLVDNISLYRLPEGSVPDKGTTGYIADTAFDAAAAAGKLPYVPSSPGHRPNSVRFTLKTSGPAGLILPGTKSAESKSALSLDVRNLLGDKRKGTLTYRLQGIGGRDLARGETAVTLPPFGASEAALTLPEDMPFGPMVLHYELRFDGEAVLASGTARLGTAPPRATTVAERGRMDYPFSLWAHSFRHNIGTPRSESIGRLVEAAGMGKTWFGSGEIWYGVYVSIEDDAERANKIADQIEKSRQIAAEWRKYGVTPMGFFQPPANLIPESQFPRLREVISTFVSELAKDGINIWRHGTESMHGGVRELDRAELEKEGMNAQGHAEYLYWGRKGTVRQYWQEYVEAYRAAKAANPDCLFGPNVASDIGGNVLRLFFQVRKPEDLDIFGMNTYISPYSLWSPNIREFEANGLDKIPIFASEYAGSNGSDPMAPNHLELECAAASRMVKKWAEVLAAFPNFFHIEMWGLILADDENSLTSRGEIRPPFLAYANMTNLLGAGRFRPKIEVPGVHLYLRDRSVQSGPVAILWTDGYKVPLELEIAAPEATVVDLWGNRSQVRAEEGRVTVTAGPEPVYVLGGDFIGPAAGFRMEIGHASRNRAAWEVEVRITNERKTPADGSLELIADGPLRIHERKQEVHGLAPGETRRVVFSVQPAGTMRDTRLPLRARFVVDGKRFESGTGLNFHRAGRLVKSPEGTPAPAWDEAEMTLVADRPDQANPSPTAWKGPSDLSVRAGFRWDGANLYVRFAVRDDRHLPAPVTTNMWQKDVIELLIDVNRTLAPGPHFTMLSLADLSGGPKVHRWDGPLPAKELETASVTFRRDGDLSIYEAAIPWKEIDPAFQPRPGAVISLAWTVDDSDEDGAPRRGLSWASEVNDKNPAQFGDLILVE